MCLSRVEFFEFDHRFFHTAAEILCGRQGSTNVDYLQHISSSVNIGCRVSTLLPYAVVVLVNANFMMLSIWWGSVFDPDEDLSYGMVGPHGVTLVAQMIDGFWINRIPIRFKHWWISVFPFCLCYAVWTYLQDAVLDIENPLSSAGNLLYEQIDWESDFTNTILYILIAVFVAGPTAQFCLFLISLYHIPCLCIMDRRRYWDTTKQDDDSLDQTSFY